MPQPISFDAMADRYDATRNDISPVAGEIAAGLIRLGNLAPGASLLEVAIGTGRISLPLLAEGVNVTGADISARMVERLRAKYDERRAAEPARTWGALTTVMADVTDLPLAAGAFDAALAVHIFHLVADWRRALEEALRCVKPGGTFLIGQDTRPANDTQWQIQEQWLDIVREIGFDVALTYPGAGYSQVVRDLRGRGLVVAEEVLATWEVEQTPRQMLRWITERLWSRTWGIPDEVFDESVRQLTAWTQRRFLAEMDLLVPVSASFKVARARVR